MEPGTNPGTVTPPAVPGGPTKIEFLVKNVVAGVHLVRLRVDGVEGIPVAYSGDPPVPEFDASQQVTVP